MPLPQHVTRRGNKLWYRRAYPKELWPITGNAAFAMSLRTSDPKEALRARPEAERKYHAKVDGARTQLALEADRPPLTKAAAEAIAVRWFLRSLENAEDFRSISGPEALADALDDNQWMAGEARRALAEGDLGDVQRLARCLRERAGYASEPVADAALVKLLARQAVAAFEVEAGRLKGRYGTRPADPLFAAAMEAPAPVEEAPPPPRGEPPARTVSDLEASFRAERFPHFSNSAQAAYEPTLRLLREGLGADIPLSSVTHEDGLRLFQMAQAIPTNANKRPELRGRTLAEQIEEGRRLGLPTISAKTINDSYMTNLGTLFRFAQQRGWVAFNPVQGRRVRDSVAPGDRREPFKQRLPVLFGAAPWTPRDASEAVHYFGPLLALYHGLRLAEIVGLQVGDVGKEQGQPMLYIRAGKRGLKGRGSRRDLPLHPELVRLGFLSFVESREKAGATAMLFEGQKPNKRGQWGRGLSQWFAALVQGRGLEGRNLTLHALRHDYRDALREADIEETLADYLFGHAQQGVKGVYGGQRPYSIARLSAAVAKVRYPELNLPAPAKVPGRAGSSSPTL